jgi:hypothetical protein
MIALEARVRIEGIVDLTPEIFAASGYPGFRPLKVWTGCRDIAVYPLS